MIFGVIAVRAANLVEISVQFENVPTARAAMEAIDVLGDEGHARQAVFKFGDGLMGGIGLNPGKAGSSVVIELPDGRRIVGERLGGGERQGIATFPEPLRSSKGGHAAFGRDAGACENRQTSASREEFRRAPNRVHSSGSEPLRTARTTKNEPKPSMEKGAAIII